MTSAGKRPSALPRLKLYPAYEHSDVKCRGRFRRIRTSVLSPL